MVSHRSLTFSVSSRPGQLPLSPATMPGPLDRRADPHKVTKADIETHFSSHGTGEITEIKLMNGFGFIEYKDAMDARDVVPGKLYTTTLSPALSVQMTNATFVAAFRTSPPSLSGYLLLPPRPL